jgi:hypothetical protein
MFLVVSRWLVMHQDLRLAVDDGCKCTDELLETRTTTQGVWKADPGYHPYYVIGDFDGDGQEDIAIGVNRRSESKKFQVLIINGYRSGGTCAYLSPKFDFDWGLFFGPPRSKPYRLLVGPFNTDVGTLFLRGRGCHYVLR